MVNKIIVCAILLRFTMMINGNLSDHCQSSSCQNGATCTATKSSQPPYYTCTCKPAYQGQECQDRKFITKGNCKYHVNSGMTLKFVTANSTCFNLGGSLAMIKSSDTQDLLENQTIDQYGSSGAIELWIGGYKSDNVWIWMDGTYIPRSGPNQKWEQSTKDYMLLSAWESTRDNMRWFSRTESQSSRGYICEVAVNDPCTPVSCDNGGTCVATGCQSNCICPPEYQGQQCDERIFVTNGNCKYHVNVQSVNFTTANSTCSILGGSLAMVKSSDIQDNIENQIISQYGSDGHIAFWLGGSNESYKWLWMDGTEIPLTGPNNKWQDKSGKYLVLSSWRTTRVNMNWYSRGSLDKRGYICEVAVHNPCAQMTCENHEICIATGCQGHCIRSPGFNGVPTDTSKTRGPDSSNAFVIAIIVLGIMLVASLITNGILCVKQRKMRKKATATDDARPHKITYMNETPYQNDNSLTIAREFEYKPQASASDSRNIGARSTGYEVPRRLGDTADNPYEEVKRRD